MSALDVRSIAVHRGDRRVVEDVSFSAAAGELLTLMGSSGAGKSTVLRAISGLDPLAAGVIDVAGIRLTADAGASPQDVRELHRRVGMVFQFHHLFSHLDVIDNVCLAPVHVLGRSRADAERRGLELLDMLGVADRSRSKPDALSGGEAQRAAIARALAVDPPVLLMDEPTASLDQARRDDLATTLRSLAAQGRTIVVATHDTEFARACAGRTVLLTGGRIVPHRPPIERPVG